MALPNEYITDSKVFYSNGYKKQTKQDFRIKTEILPITGKKVETDYLTLLPNGYLTIKRGYAWDGASGALDTKSTDRGSLVHDALYQLMRLNLVDRRFKPAADNLYRQLCIEDGMWKIRAAWHIEALRLFGQESTLEKSERPIIISP